MNRERPTAVLVMAILNFVMGGLGLLVFLCCGLGTLLFTSLMLDFVSKAAPPPTQGGPNPADLTKVFDQIPGYYAVMGTHSVLCAGLCVVVIVGGMGLLQMQNWGRYSSVAASVLFIILSLINLIYTVAIVQPGVERWQRDFAAKMGAGPMPVSSASSTMNIVMAIFGFLLYIAYPVALIVVMFLPHVSAAFAGTAPPGGAPDYDDRMPPPGPGGPSNPHVAPRRF